MLILGIDTSCDDTSIGIVRDGVSVLSSVVSSQEDLHSRYGGVVPEIASRNHLAMMIPVLTEALQKAGVTLGEIAGVAVTQGPGLMGSLLVGVSFGKSLAAGLRIPIIAVNHLEAHVYSSFLDRGVPEFPLLCLVVSGGHSDLILMEGHGKYRVLGITKDDAPGEVFDKVGRELGLDYPGGPHVDAVAEEGDSRAFHFPIPKVSGGPFDMSFSGLKTRALLAIQSSGKTEETVRNLSASFREAVVEVLELKLEEALTEFRPRSVAVTGGVSRNRLVRERVKRLGDKCGLPVLLPEPQYCTDNGAMVASCGYFRLQRDQVASYDVNAVADLELKSWEDNRP